MHVLPGDRLGLYFKTTVPPVYYGAGPFIHKVISSDPTVDNTVKFETDSLGLTFVASGFVRVSKYHTQPCLAVPVLTYTKSMVSGGVFTIHPIIPPSSKIILIVNY